MAKECDNTSVGMLIRNDRGELLLVERKLYPFGFAPPAGHVDDHGSFEKAAVDEIREEVGLTSGKLKLVAEGRKDNRCRRQGGDWHYWKVYEVEAEGDLNPSSEETKRVDWFDGLRLKELGEKTKDYLAGKISDEEWQKNPGLELVWLEWLAQLKIL